MKTTKIATLIKTNFQMIFDLQLFLMFQKSKKGLAVSNFEIKGKLLNHEKMGILGPFLAINQD